MVCIVTFFRGLVGAAPIGEWELYRTGVREHGDEGVTAEAVEGEISWIDEARGRAFVAAAAVIPLPFETRRVK